jgi:hypothetical protein
MHLTWSDETAGMCRKCKGKIILITPSLIWEADEESSAEAGVDWESHFGDGIELDEELSAHFCPKCRCLTSLSLNSMTSHW